MVTGYHFGRGGSDVTFFVRPARVDQLSERPRRLYSYDDNQIKSFEDYQVTCDMSEVGARLMAIW